MKCDHLCIKCGAPERRHWCDEIATRLVERKMCVFCDGWFFEVQAEDFCKHGRPTNDAAYCAHLARLFVRFEPGPWTDASIVNTAACMAEGGFYPAFAAADYGQKSALIDMCERALRGELASAQQVQAGGN
jgi:hypothetical protein